MYCGNTAGGRRQKANFDRGWEKGEERHETIDIGQGQSQADLGYRKRRHMQQR